MPNPVQTNQNISSAPSPLLSLPTRSSQPPLFLDSLKMGPPLQPASIFTQLWESINNCFKAIFSCFSRSSSSENVKAKISEIAARDHFVWFYKKEENPLTAFMGNFHPCPIQIWGMQFQCAEAAFQAAKFSNRRDLMQRFTSLDGDAAWRLGRALSQNWSAQDTANWRRANLNVMRDVLNAKFSQNADLKDLLLATGSAYLAEHIPVKGRDAYWGDDSDGTGQNYLGQLMMETRARMGGTGLVSRNQQYNQFLLRG
ncbi:MAG: NADAR family protein [Verrucomicrobia bacterium]|nr:NADAR family protein [Verrucomicrobiota bacterium]